jgi:hypothetical protein
MRRRSSGIVGCDDAEGILGMLTAAQAATGKRHTGEGDVPDK